MDLKKLKTRRAIVDKAFNIEAREEYIDPEYTFAFNTESRISETGFLKVFTLGPEQPQLPCFVGRWDQNKEELDIDIYDVSVADKNLFKSEKSDYGGHHTKRISVEPRTFQVDIQIPNRAIFRALITFNINLNVELHEQVTTSDAIVSVLKKSKDD